MMNLEEALRALPFIYTTTRCIVVHGLDLPNSITNADIVGDHIWGRCCRASAGQQIVESDKLGLVVGEEAVHRQVEPVATHPTKERSDLLVDAAVVSHQECHNAGGLVV
ncbi:hypothetical protein F443_02240 [Phytophthora nicotianae P1569]|uniref:Uncharacterized protein n=1 Tax=Phytophthora nicotianae P1569 TaxID=1317065 RepID=V9FU94_PHYNI|nr:hypothetical protein F443_02240 [Phytophthora nicotianae P1569]